MNLEIPTAPLSDIDLRTRYLGLDLASPFIIGASPLADSSERIRRMEEAGAGALTLHSLFEEQIEMERQATLHHTTAHDDIYGEALSYFPRYEDFNLEPDEYLEKIAFTKRLTRLPVIASLNGVTPGGWVRYARKIEDAGADALELNFYHIATNPTESGSEVEARLLEVVMSVRSTVRLPLAVKLSPFYSALPHLVAKIQATGANGVILFNRFYQPDIDIEQQETVSKLILSDSSELPMRLRWIAALHGHVSLDLILSGGVHTVPDAVKGLMAGATGIQLVSSILKTGIDHLKTLNTGLRQWMFQNEFSSIQKLRGCMSMERCPDPEVFERANYMRILQGWRI
ncbi:MAG: dihydroorotate dehydrogenase-like protein [Candidatus Methylacidiphilales bacterium]